MSRKLTMPEGEGVQCRICRKTYRVVTTGHLRYHGISRSVYMERYGLTFDELVSMATRRLLAHPSSHLYTPRTATRELVRLAARGLSPREIYATNNQLYCQAMRFFGSFEAALGAAGISYEHTVKRDDRRTTDEVLELVIGFSLQHGLRRASEARAMLPALYAAAERTFGTWYGALAAAGFHQFAEHHRRKPLTRPQIVKELRRKAKAGEDLSSQAQLLADPRFHGQVTRNAGSWAAGLRVAGLDVDAHRRQRAWSRDKVIDHLRDRAAAGRSLNIEDVRREEGHALPKAAYRHLGSWSAAIAAAFAPTNPAPRKFRASSTDSRRGGEGRAHGMAS